MRDEPDAVPAPESPSASEEAETEVTTIDTGGTQVLGLAVADGSVWAISSYAATMARIDPDTDAVTATVPVPGGASAAALPSGLWVAAYGNPGYLYRVDPEQAAITDTVDVGDLRRDLTEGAGRVWALDRAGHCSGSIRARPR